ncbi:ribonuclease HIII [Candidatus Phytoplasma ziziphi]|uniref:Ribonuclease n=1 Tax=Ziziphus jujuba witches'-broom phytoplasma TaxID=135727 RepID=A0A660HLR3_ZIZJU|nr:ribonuclease HIII [Candidatus Phytoplasma ziziphi]AYJ00988.1 ribonuclease HIII [Candidatus Phytoplasma ziziphi]
MRRVHVFKNLKLEQFETLKKSYEKFILSGSQKDIYLIIKKSKIRITCYNNGTCLIQGNDVSDEIEYIRKLLYLNFDKSLNNLTNFKIPNNKDIMHFNEEIDDINDKNIIGSDEVGIGDVFGPIIVCSALVTKEQIPFLQQIGVRDSKKISNCKIQQIMLMVKDKISYSVQILSPSEYNILNQKYNLNNIKALLHNKAILDLLKKINKDAMVVLDQFASPQNYFNYLKNEKKVYKKIIFEIKAESKYLSVALASIIARNIFLEEMDKLSNKIGIKLRLGAGYTVDQQINEIYQKNKEFIFFQKIAKCNFKNIKRYFK